MTFIKQDPYKIHTAYEIHYKLENQDYFTREVNTEKGHSLGTGWSMKFIYLIQTENFQEPELLHQILKLRLNNGLES